MIVVRRSVASCLGSRKGSHARRGLAAATCGLAAVIASGAQAQVAPSNVLPPPPADLTRPLAPLATPSPPLVIHPGSDGSAPAGAADIQVQVTSISVDGVSAYPAGALDPLWRGLVGRKAPLSELFAAAQRIQARYRADGYVLTRVVVPEQNVANGAFHIRVVEGFVSDVEITGDAGDAQPLVRRYLDKITRSRPARLADIERYLLLANDLPGISARAVLTSEPDSTGGARMVVALSRKPLDAFATLNNEGSDFAGPLTGTLGLAVNGLGPGDTRVAGTFFSTLNSEQQFGELSIETRVGSEGGAVRVWGSSSPSAPGSIFAPLDIRSLSTVVGIGASYPLVRSRRLDLSVQGSFEVTDDSTRTLGQLASVDRSRIFRLGLTGDVTDDWGGVTSGSVTLHQGLDGLGATHDGGPIPQSRLGAPAGFFKVTATASRLQPLYAGRDSTLALQLSAAGQYAADNLLSLEQFHIGGDSFGRGFNPAQFSGDDGVGASAELQFTEYRRLGPISRYQLYAFYDAARVGDRDASGPWQGLQSVGGGVRADIGPRLSAQVEVADPFSPGRLDGTRLDKGPQVLFRLTARY